MNVKKFEYKVYKVNVNDYNNYNIRVMVYNFKFKYLILLVVNLYNVNFILILNKFKL